MFMYGTNPRGLRVVVVTEGVPGPRERRWPRVPWDHHCPMIWQIRIIVHILVGILADLMVDIC